jgi:tRNA1Val (adenine37-N6)-methyltransferase
MPQQPFQFKQFSVAQNKCAMKVNTDGVLLGAWAGVGNAARILDIGTGTGVIALMMAQKCWCANIDAIDIDADAFLQAGENFEQSAWSHRLRAHHVALQNFEAPLLYDVIVSNPPYFVDDTKTKSRQQNVARHAIALSYAHLLQAVNRLLAGKGTFFVVLPIFNFTLFKTQAATHFLFVHNLTEVIAVEGKPPYLALAAFTRTRNSFFKNTVTIQNNNGNFTEAYKILTKNFYLKF